MTLEKAKPITIRIGSILEPAGNLSVPDPGSRVPVLNWEQATRGSGPALHVSLANHLDADAYQIALVPIEIGKDGPSLLSPQSSGVGLLLSLVSQDIASQINNHPSYPDRSHAESVVQFGEVRVNFLTMEVYRSRRLLTSTAMEFKTLK